MFSPVFLWDAKEKQKGTSKKARLESLLGPELKDLIIRSRSKNRGLSIARFELSVLQQYVKIENVGCELWIPTFLTFQENASASGSKQDLNEKIRRKTANSTDQLKVVVLIPNCRYMKWMVVKRNDEWAYPLCKNPAIIHNVETWTQILYQETIVQHPSYFAKYRTYALPSPLFESSLMISNLALFGYNGGGSFWIICRQS